MFEAQGKHFINIPGANEWEVYSAQPSSHPLPPRAHAYGDPLTTWPALSANMARMMLAAVHAPLSITCANRCGTI